MTRVDMGAFWDERAEEDAFYFVDNRLEYGSPDLERFWAEGEEELRSMLATFGLEVPPGARVVEIGCGVGRMTRALAGMGAEVVAIDVSRRMLELAQTHNPGLQGVQWCLGDGHSLREVDDESADICHSAVVFQHIPDPEITYGYVAEIGRVLKPGGWAFYMVSNVPETPWHRKRSLRVRLPQLLRAALGRAPRGQAHPAWLGSAIEVDALRSAAGAGGCEISALDGEGTPYCLVLQRKRG